jgi:NTP pyrophosphatase (non-canonical NTP hydrolase)
VGQMKKLYTDQIVKTMNVVMDDVVAERWRQVETYGHQTEKTNSDWLAILVEEVGEAAQALQKGSASAKETDAGNLYEEVVQAAAVCLKWAETIRGYK